jgi:hypothetical protein
MPRQKGRASRHENRAQNIDRLDQILNQMSVKGEANSNQSPKGGKPFGDGHEVGVGRVALNDLSIKVNGSAGAEGIEFGGLGRQGSGEKCRYQQPDNPVRQLLQDKGYKNVISVGCGSTWIDRRQCLGSLFADLFTHSMRGQSGGEGGAGRRTIMTTRQNAVAMTAKITAS